MSETMALGERFRWLAFLARHANLIPALLALFAEWQAATTIDAKAEVIKSLIDLLKGIVGDIPTGLSVIDGDIQALMAGEEQNLELKLGDGQLLKRLLENLPALIQLITTLSGLFGKAV